MLRRYDDEATFYEACSRGRDFQALEQRRLWAGRRFARGASQAEVAREFGVSRQTASRWYQAWRSVGCGRCVPRLARVTRPG
jgi:transposase